MKNGKSYTVWKRVGFYYYFDDKPTEPEDPEQEDGSDTRSEPDYAERNEDSDDRPPFTKLFSFLCIESNQFS
ncbi:MAG TPA: hypothetical protein VMM38_13325 [Aridibacter sp.]|nr:hypothetical protein [Aridibacter sp.]